MAWYNWSQTAASNATADSSINWAEGQAPSSVNDSARAMMAVTAKYRDDNNGTLTTGGTSTAYTLSTNSNYDTLAHLNGQALTFTMNATSGITPTLNVDSLGAKPIRQATGVALPTGALLSGSVYTASYNNTSGEFLLINQPGVLASGSVNTASIAASAVQYANIQNVTNNTILGNVSGSAAAPEEITIGGGLLLSGTTISAPATPVPGSFKNLSIKVASNTTVAVAADFVTMTDGTNFLTHSLSGTVNLGTNGAANALDTGTIAIDTWYAIWAIAKSDGTTAALASTSSSAPTMPTGYTYKARIGWVRTIHTSATLYGTWQLGRTAQYVVGLAQTSALVAMITGISGNITTPTWTAVSVSSFVPTTAGRINLMLSTGVTASGCTAAPNNSYGGNGSTTNMPPLMINGAGTVNQNASVMGLFILESTNVYFASSEANAMLACIGWEDNI